MLSSGNTIVDDVVLAFEPLQWEETDALAIQYNGRVVKEDMCHFGDYS